MTKPAKLYLNLLANPRQSIGFREFESLVLAFGFTLRRTRGSHKQYRHEAVSDLLTITEHGKDADAYQVRLLLDIVEEFGLFVSR